MGLYIYNCNSFVIKNDCSNHIYYISRIISVLMWTPQTDRPHCVLKNYNILHLVCASAPSQCSLYHDSHLRCFPLLSQLSLSNSPLANHASMLAHLCSLYHVAYRLHVGIRIMTVCASATVAMLIIS